MTLLYDEDRVAAITARLELREPNRVALETIGVAVSQHFDVEGAAPPFRAVIDAATGVGKTYILAAAMEYFAVDGTRNFAVIAPGRTILEKTQANFTAGHPKSLLGGMEIEPVVITSETFASAAMRNAMDDPDKVKLYIFTVQSLTKPGSKQGKRTHDFNENLGEAFYATLQAADDLVVFADEHHTYFGDKFSEAVDELHPRVLLGLTATPHPKTPEEQIIYRYPLAAAIADKLVKTPVLVGRKDDRSDVETKLLDGLALLKLKQEAVAAYCAAEGRASVNPLMLVIAQNIDEAREIEAALTAPGFAGGEYADKVLTVHSDAPDQALADLDELEEPSSPYRIVVSVGMLKEGWDNKAVYVIASMRASVSTILTEQTLGRGLRLPFGAYTGIEFLDTLEVLAHERYEELLKKANVINQGFIDHRTQAVLKRNLAGQLVPTIETTEVSTFPAQAGGPAIASIDEVQRASAEQLAQLRAQLSPRPELPRLQIPVLKMGSPKSTFSLADITETDAFEQAGASIAANPEDELRRTTVSARVMTGADGLRHTELVTARAVDKVTSTGSLLPLDEARADLLTRVLGAGIVPARAKERTAAAPIVDAFLAGLGSEAQTLLSAYMDRAAAKLIALIASEHGRFRSEVRFDSVVELAQLSKVRIARPTTTANKAGKFERGSGYEYGKSLFAQDWFDSGPERDVANILDDAGEIECWVRLQRNDLPIVWAEHRDYNPDFIAIEKARLHFVVEVKMNKEMTSADVLGKRKAARRWVNHVNASPKVEPEWAYLLVSEDDVRTASGSWAALKKLAS